jgi:hypothetical protein
VNELILMAPVGFPAGNVLLARSNCSRVASKLCHVSRSLPAGRAGFPFSSLSGAKQLLQQLDVSLPFFFIKGE